jgi:predicted NUDIX family NTP pyrophosphohydrolase
MSRPVSAGLLLYRRAAGGGVEVFLAHPGGPFWARRDADPAAVRSNPASTEWPRGSGRTITFPEVDRCAWFAPDAAREKIIPAQAELIARLVSAVG